MARRQQEDPKAEMTPMIDVVFQLMIFFIVTIKQDDIFSKLNASAFNPDDSTTQEQQDDKDAIVIQINPDVSPDKATRNTYGVQIDGAPYTYAALDKYLQDKAKISKETSVRLMCPIEAPQGNLMIVLDYCKKHQFNNLCILGQ